MPADEGLRLDHGDRAKKRWEDSVQPDQEQPIGTAQPYSGWRLAAWNQHLLSQNQALRLRSHLRAQMSSDDEQELSEEREHRASHYHTPVLASRRIKFSWAQQKKPDACLP